MPGICYPNNQIYVYNDLNRLASNYSYPSAAVVLLSSAFSSVLGGLVPGPYTTHGPDGGRIPTAARPTPAAHNEAINMLIDNAESEPTSRSMSFKTLMLNTLAKVRGSKEAPVTIRFINFGGLVPGPLNVEP